jgi:hypothetical protein
MKRRDLLKAATLSLPAVTVLGPQVLFGSAKAGSSIKKLNLIIQGPFICLLHDDGAEIFAPRVDKHLYDINHDSAREGTYQLTGVRGIHDARDIQYVLPKGGEAFRLSLEELHLTLHRQKAPYFGFLAPLPKQIVAVVSREAEIIDASGQRRSVMMPTAYAFVYDVDDPGNLQLTGDESWKPGNRLGREEIVNLTVATGLPAGVQDPNLEHFHMALAGFKSYLPELKLNILRIGAERRTAQLAGYPGIEARTAADDCRLPPILVPPKPPASR